MDDGTVLVVEEVRTGNKELTLNTMWKYPRGLPATQAIQLAMRANVRNDTRDIDVSIVENPKPRNSLYTVEAVDTNEKSSAVSWAATEIEKEFQGLERLPSTEDVNILAKIVDDFNSNKEKYNTQYKLIRIAVDRATGKHKDKVNLISRADFARVLANRGKSADYIKTNNYTVNAYFDTASGEINIVYNQSYMTPDLTAFAAWHELGHYGFRLPRSQEYKVVLDTANKHSLIKELLNKHWEKYEIRVGSKT